MLDTQQLAVLVGVARTGSYTAAAESLGYTQPAVSYRMRALERRIGLPLAIRVGRGVRLTPAGLRLAQHAETLLAALRDVENELGAYAARARATVRVCAVPGACVSLLPKAVAKLRTSEPGAEVVIDRVSSSEAVRSLQSGDSDLALVNDGPGADPESATTAASGTGLLRLPLLSERHYVLFPTGHPLAGRRSPHLSDLSGEDWILGRERTRFLAACDKAGFAPRIAATTDDHLTARGLVEHGVGLATADGLDLPPGTRGPVVARPLGDFPDRRVDAVVRRESLRLPAVAALVTAVCDTAQERSPDGTPTTRATAGGGRGRSGTIRTGPG